MLFLMYKYCIYYVIRDRFSSIFFFVRLCFIFVFVMTLRVLLWTNLILFDIVLIVISWILFMFLFVLVISKYTLRPDSGQSQAPATWPRQTKWKEKIQLFSIQYSQVYSGSWRDHLFPIQMQVKTTSVCWMHFIKNRSEKRYMMNMNENIAHILFPIHLHLLFVFLFEFSLFDSGNAYRKSGWRKYTNFAKFPRFLMGMTLGNGKKGLQKSNTIYKNEDDEEKTQNTTTNKWTTRI